MSFRRTSSFRGERKSLEFKDRARLIVKYRNEIGKGIDPRSMYEALSPYLSEKQRFDLQKYTSDDDLGKRIMNLVYRQVSTDLYNIFLECLERNHPELFKQIATARWQAATRKRKAEGTELHTEEGLNKEPKTNNYPSNIGHANGTCGDTIPEEVDKNGVVDHINSLGTNISMLHNDLTDEDVKKILHKLSNHNLIESFHITAWKISTGDTQRLFGYLSEQNKLKNLSFEGSLCLNDCINDLENVIRKCTKITYLSLNSCQISSDKWKLLSQAIAGMANLKELSLNDTSMGDAGILEMCASLKEKKGLEVLSMEGNEISDDSVKFLKECVAQIKCLRKLSLARNQVTDDGAKILSGVSQFQRVSCKFDLSDNQIGYTGANALLSGWPDATFYLQNNQIDCSKLSAFMPVTCLSGNVVGSERVKIVVTKISRSTSFPIVSLNEMGLKDADVELLLPFLRMNKNLRKLELQDNDLTEKSIVLLAEIYHQSEKMFINLKDIRVSDQKLVKYFHQGHELQEPRMPFFLSTTFKNCIDSQVDSIIMTDIRTCRYDIPALFSIIQKPYRIIRFVECKLNEDDVKIICDHVNKYRGKAAAIEFSGNQLGDKGAQTLSNCFLDPQKGMIAKMSKKMFKRKQWIDHELSELGFRENELTVEGLKSLMEVMKLSESLRYVNLADNRLGPKGGKLLAKFLEEDNELESLDMSGNNLNDEGLLYLAAGLQMNTSLKCLDISDNSVSASGAAAFTRRMTGNKKLEFLGLGMNEINDCKSKGAFSEFCESIVSLVSLKFLDLRDNGLAETSFKTLAKSLSRSSGSTLLKLDVSRNEIPCNDLKHLVVLLKKGITHIDFSLQKKRSKSGQFDSDSVLKYFSACSTFPVFVGLRDLSLSKDNVTQIAECIGKRYKELKGASTPCVIDLSGNNLDRTTERSLVSVRMEYGSPRCVFENDDGEDDYLEHPMNTYVIM